MWSKLDGTLEIGYCIFNVGEIAGAVKTRLECVAEVVGPQRHVCMAVWSELDGTLEIGYRIFKVSEIASVAKARFKCIAEVAEP